MQHTVERNLQTISVYPVEYRIEIEISDVLEAMVQGVIKFRTKEATTRTSQPKHSLLCFQGPFDKGYKHDHSTVRDQKYLNNWSIFPDNVLLL